jgi:uncharacterized protein YcbX
MTLGTARLGYSVRPEPIRTLACYRREPEYDGKVSFATKAAVLRAGTIAVGDEVRVQVWEDGVQR